MTSGFAIAFPPMSAPRRLHALYRSALLALLFMSASTALTAAPADRPPAGTDVDQTRTVAQRQQPAADCLAVAFEGVTVRLDRQALARQAAARPARWRTEAERLALIEADRAAALLSAAADAADAHGCAQRVEAPLGAAAQAVVLAALENGSAAVYVKEAAEPVPAVAIRYLGSRCGPTCGRGHIMVSVPGARAPFLVQEWWVA